jgi:hypothetical protein
VQSTIDSISEAQNGIAALAKATVSGEKPDQAIFDGVVASFKAAGQSIANISCTDENAMKLATQAQNEFLQVQQGADGVLKTC